MQQNFSETFYPNSYREEEIKKLVEYINNRHSLEIIGMKRVGISNFLRFFLYHPNLAKHYLPEMNAHMFIAVDLYDLVEKELFAFWILTFKRLLDQVENTLLSEQTKIQITHLFTSSIQTKDLFLTIDNLRSALTKIVAEGIYPTFFFIRFDRMSEIASEELLANFQGMKEASGQKITYIFTSFRPLESLIPQAKIRSYLSIFDSMYIKPAQESDMRHVYESFKKRYQTTLSDSLVDELISLSGGHVQYLQLGLLISSQKLKETIVTRESLFTTLLQDERIILLSQEILESLTPDETTILKIVAKNKTLSKEDLQKTKYLVDTGILCSTESTIHIFSPLLTRYLQEQEEENDSPGELSKKEHLLYNFLLDHIDSVCERDSIIQSVWPEYEEFGVSDWTIDRLIARLRAKLKLQQSNYSIITVKTRGYKLIEG